MVGSKLRQLGLTLRKRARVEKGIALFFFAFSDFAENGLYIDEGIGLLCLARSK